MPQSTIHRDISPSNVLISRSGEVMLTDFGVAKAITGTARKQSAIKGKIPYMSPEQLRGDDIDGRSDLFALGVVMFEALSGQRPYEGANDPATILLTLKGEHPSLRSLAAHAPSRLCEVIESLIEPELEKRPQTAAELAEALDELTPHRRTRRKLGEMAAETPRQSQPLIGEPESSVAETRRGPSRPSTRKPETGAGGQAGSEAQASTVRVDSPKRGSAPVSKKQRHRRWWVAAAVLGATVSAGLLALTLRPTSQSGVMPPPREEAAMPSTTSPSAAMPSAFEAERPPDETGPTARTEAAPEPNADPEGGPAAAAGPKPVPKTTDRRKTATSATLVPAKLTVIAIPWGNVWIDGKPAGNSPLKDVAISPGRHEISVGRGSPTKSETVRLKPGQRKTIRLDLTE
ncbi:MAG: protein kinase [Deltaproteobacteria bacterium]|jgi:serine/threonine protein kinase|nr:protein kinase [Deltaproteobacteria bacterium]